MQICLLCRRYSHLKKKHLNIAVSKIQHDLDSLMNLCHRNSIFINPSKTKYMVFSTTDIKRDTISPKIDDREIEKVPHFNYLGVVLDQHLTFENHAKYTLNRVSSKIYLLTRMRKYLTSRAALLIYKNMILPVLEYGDVFLSSATKENRSKLQKLQNKALKCALGRDKKYNTSNLHKEAKLLKLKHRRKLHLLLNMHKLSNISGFKGWKNRAHKKKLMMTKKPNLTKF